MDADDEVAGVVEDLVGSAVLHDPDADTPALPARTVADDVLRFTSHTYFSAARHSPSIPEQHRTGEYRRGSFISFQNS